MNQIFNAKMLGDADPASGSKFFDRTAVENLVTIPILKESVALQVSEVVRPAVGQRVEIPFIDAEEDAEEDAWISLGAQAPNTPPPNTKALVMNHHKTAKQTKIPWDTISDSTFNVAEIYGASIVRKLTRAIDRAYFREDGTAPVYGVGRLEGVNKITVAGLKNTDPFIDVIEYTENLDAIVDHFVMSPTTFTTVSKLKKSASSEESLLGTNAAPGTPDIQNVPLVKTLHVPDGVIWAIPKSRMYVSLRQDVTLALDQTAYFSEMSAGLLGSVRVSMGSIQPSAITRILIDA